MLAWTLVVILLLPANSSWAAKPQPQHQHQRRRHQEAADPMEPCYLANNRASESLTISESTPVGTVVGEIMVNGDSSASRGNIELSMRMPAAAAAAAANVHLKRDLRSLMELMPPLSIEPNTKRLILAKKLDRENLDRYMAAGGYSAPAAAASALAQSSSAAALTVHIKCQLRAQNRSGDTAAAAAAAASILIPVHLIVTDDNDNWPVFLNGPYLLEVNESAPAGSPPAGNEILAVDGDQQGPLSTIEYSLLPGSPFSSAFAFLNPLDARSLVVREPGLLDHEAQPKLQLQVLARDQGEPPNWAVATLHVNLLDQDDQGPRFGEDQYRGRVRLGLNRPGEPVELLPRRLVARDADKSLQAPLVYSFHGPKTNHSAHFELDPDLGRLTLRKSLPDSFQAPFCLLVKASQLDQPARFTLAAVQMRLDTSLQEVEQLLLNGANRADHQHQQQAWKQQALQFPQANYTIELSEAAPPGTSLIQLQLATSQPEDYHQLDYLLLDDDLGQFQLDQRTGRLSLNKSLDYELYRSLSVRVLATGSERSQGRLSCDTTRVTVRVINHNEQAPEFSHEQYNFQLSVSDLIANFDQDRQEKGDQDGPPEDLAVRSMKLGQVYCADRDFGDRVGLQLRGPKAQLFHLTQEGRLYLPLANQSEAQPAKRLLIQGQPLDRQYLNHLLGELSNLGRLRMKVLAADDGRPEVRQSSALIVVTIISIDSFISFHQHQHPPPETTSQPIQLTNETSYDTGASGTVSMVTSPSQQQQQQLMMIPATNGRSYVQINPDIIGNLIHASNTNDSSHEPDQMLASASSLNRTLADSQPPSLLLVDDEGGAKFVAMPQAIDIYQQQVQEQQARLRQQQQQPKVAASQDSWWPGAWWRGRESGGLVYWLNASTALLLHLITVGVVVALLARLRNSGWWPSGGASASGQTCSGAGLFFAGAHQQPGLFSGWGSSGGSSGAKASGEPSLSGLVDDNAFGFLQTNSYLDSTAAKTSCGLVVSAMSAGGGASDKQPDQQEDTLLAETEEPKSEAKSSTFVGGSKQCDQGQASVVSISVSAPADTARETAKETGNPKTTKVGPEETAGAGRKLASSSSSSVVSLVSLSSSSISNKIAASVERAATGSDVSSLDSNSLFTSTNSSNSHGAPLAPPAPPPLPPPPPCVVQAGTLSASKPFSSPPTVSLRPSDLRRPAPQNPAHVKLRLQAAQLGAAKHKAVQTGPPPPPLPPPMPSSLANVKTVSPTTSVDRGYESLQSYTSSSHHHNHHHHLHRHQKSQDLTRLSSQQQQQHQQRAPYKPRPSSTTNKQPAVGRQAQRQQADSLLTKSSNQSSSVQLEQRQRKLAARHYESGGCQRLDCKLDETAATEEEDDEFYCCYDQGAAPAGKAVDGLLSEYASHAYKPAETSWQPQGCHHHQQQQHQQQQQHRSRLPSTAARGNDLMMIKYHHHHQPAGHDFYHRQQRYQHQFGHHQQPLNKKQLTWSDQVDHLA